MSIIAITVSIIAIIVSLFSLWISFQNLKIKKYAIRREFYLEVMKILRKIQEIAGSRESVLEFNDIKNNVLQYLDIVPFLFGEDVKEFIEKLWRNANTLPNNTIDTNKIGRDESIAESIKEIRDMRKEAPILFLPYLDLRPNPIIFRIKKLYAQR